ncbi:MAG: small subunit ribosomal protein [Thermoleophilaceae bacterium]|jgi:small subunit ribosomal protein S9|nr:small subunit ribosomal protein [Thermoleophilaceae bacterium]
MADEQTPPEEPGADETSADASPVSPDEAGNEGQGEASTPDTEQGSAGSPGDEGEAATEEPAAEEPAPAVAEEPAAEPAEEPAPAASEEPAPAAAEAEEPASEEPAADTPAEEPAPAAASGQTDERRQRPPRRDEDEQPQEEAVVPGAHLEPDLVLEEKRPAEGEFDPYADPSATADDSPVAEGEEAATVDDTPAARTPLELAADARYRATGKRKRAIARVILKPGAGTYTINGKQLDVYFPRVTLQKHARLPLETTGNDSRMDVVAKIHGGGVSAQATALRHGIARALVEADPNLRGELKRHGFLTRDARVKERKKAGLKKARKRPQFSKR